MFLPRRDRAFTAARPSFRAATVFPSRDRQEADALLQRFQFPIKTGSIPAHPLRYDTCMPPDTLAQARRDYLDNQAMITTPTEVVQVFYQVAIDNVRAAMEFLKTGDAMARARVVTKAEEAVDELILSLDHSVGAQFTHTLEDLYRYILNQIMTGHARQSEQAFKDALTILESLADTWTKVRAKLSAESGASEIEAAKQAAYEVSQELLRESGRDLASHNAYSSGSDYSQGCPVAPGRDWSA